MANDRITSSSTMDGCPIIRGLGIPVADLLSELIFGATEDDLLDANPGLTREDVAAAREYESAKHPLDEVIDRALNDSGEDLTTKDVLDLYVRLPRIVLSHHEHPIMGTPVNVRSSFEAAYSDAMETVPHAAWLAALGVLCFFDEVGGAVRSTLASDVAKTTNVEKGLAHFTDVSPEDALVLYALRCAFAHHYSLINVGKGQRAEMLHHAFVLVNDPDLEWLVTIPKMRWDGQDMLDLRGRQTEVNLARLFAVAGRLRSRVVALHEEGNLSLVNSSAETRRRYVFTHEVEITELDAQQLRDEDDKWGRGSHSPASSRST